MLKRHKTSYSSGIHSQRDITTRINKDDHDSEKLVQSLISLSQEASYGSFCFALTNLVLLLTSHELMSPLNVDASRNMDSKFVTVDTFQLETLGLHDV